MIKIALLTILFCMNAFAGYECEVTLSTASESHEAIAFDIIKAGNSDLNSRNIENFFEEKNNKSLSLKVFMDGWAGEEQTTIKVVRVDGESSETISEKLSLLGNSQGSIWFDDYKLEANCSIN